MSFEPYLRDAGDGTFELLVPSAGGAVHILPYCFHTEEDAANWLASRKGRERIKKIRIRYDKSKRAAHRYTLHTAEAALS
ncbi:MAG: hypothetical protein HY765_10585 [Rhodomicrobium sp.]|nr:hypothetical protein [Rhodomicrobium sp.]